MTLAANGREVLAAFEKENFDAIPMNVQMPQMDGFETTGKIREHEKILEAHCHHRDDRERTEGLMKIVVSRREWTVTFRSRFGPMNCMRHWRKQ